MRVLVLGATGFLGAHIVRALERDRRVDDVVGVARRVPPGRPGWRAIDLLAAGPRVIDGLLADFSPDAIVNAAGRTTGHAAELHGLNTAMVERLVAAMQRRVPGARLVHLGSGAEYGPAPQGHHTLETDEPRPVGAYGRTKLAATRLVWGAGFLGLDTVVLRVFNPIGAEMDERTMPGNAARQVAAALADPEVEVRMGPLDAYRDFVDAGDVAAAVVCAIHRRGARGEVLNIGTGRAVPGRDVVQCLAGIAGYDGDIHEERAGSERSAPVSWQEADVTRVRRILGWEATTPLADSVGALWRSATTEVDLRDGVHAGAPDELPTAVASAGPMVEPCP